MSNYKLDPNNARKHTPRNEESVQKSLNDLGAGRSIVVDNDDVVVAGNTVYEKAEVLGIKTKEIEADGSELVVVVRDDLTPGDPKRDMLAIADNRTAELAQWDFDVLAEQIGQIMESEVPIPAMGFTAAEAALMMSDDEFGGGDEDLPVAPASAPGAQKTKNFIVTIVSEEKARVEVWLSEHGLGDNDFGPNSHTMVVIME